MTVQSGRFGSVNGQSTVRNWTLNDTADVKKFAASNTKGGMGARNGARDWTGSFGTYGGLPLVLPGETFAFLGSTGPDNAGPASYSGQAIVDQVQITWNYGSQEIIAAVVNFSGDGELTYGTDAGGDLTAPTAPEVCGTTIDLDATPIPDVEQCVLTITADNKPYVNSDTVFNGACWTKRRPGNIDWTAAITQQNGAGVSPVIQTDYILRCYTHKDGVADEFWELKWGKLGNSSGITVNPETGDIVRRTLNLSMNGFPVAGGVGHILDPSGGTFWPAA